MKYINKTRKETRSIMRRGSKTRNKRKRKLVRIKPIKQNKPGNWRL